MVNLYLDGCSMTYGVGLNESDRLSSLFTSFGYNVINFSRPGKSNIAIAQDTYNNMNEASVFVIGFTFAERFCFQYNNYSVDLLPSNVAWPINNERLQGNEMEIIVTNLHENFYKLFDINHWNNISDMLIDNTIDAIKLQNKQIFAFSWQIRKTRNKLVYPIIADRLKDGHLNANGTKKLFQLIQNCLPDQ